MFENLEMRRLLSGTTSSQSGTQLSISGMDVTIVEDFQVPGRVVVRDNPTGTEEAFTGVTNVTFSGLAGADRVFFTGHTVDSQINGGGGSDVITVSDEGTGTSTVNGEGADDQITVLYANDTKVIGDGGGDEILIQPSVNDSFGTKTTYIYGMGGNDRIIIYAGINYVNGGAGGQDTLIDSSNGAAVIIEMGGIENHG
jgi:hypothetical protein